MSPDPMLDLLSTVAFFAGMLPFGLSVILYVTRRLWLADLPDRVMLLLAGCVGHFFAARILQFLFGPGYWGNDVVRFEEHLFTAAAMWVVLAALWQVRLPHSGTLERTTRGVVS